MKNFKLHIRSSIWELDGEGNRIGSAEISESCYDAKVSLEGGVIARFDEVTEGGRICSEISFLPDEVTVKKSGAIESRMVFRSGECYSSLYRIPPYSFDMQIATKALKCSVTPSGGEATVLYRMEIGGAAKSASMKITLGEGREGCL